MQYQRKNFISGTFSLRQTLKILCIGLSILRLRFSGKNIDTVYLVISSSSWGNLRDIFLLSALGKKLRGRTVIHFHGANLDKYLEKAPLYVKALNKIFFKGIKNAIVLGNSLKEMFNGFVPQEKIRIVSNFAGDGLFISRQYIHEKFKLAEGRKASLLFLSNMIKSKGYEVLLNAYLALNPTFQDKIELNLAGHFYSATEEQDFLLKIKQYPGIRYHGSVIGERKAELLKRAHIFCLPTYYEFEAQPIAILEAYAAGCFVITTRRPSILDIFKDGINGYGLPDSSNPESLTTHLTSALKILSFDVELLNKIANHNRTEAESKYYHSRFCTEIEHIIASE